jgi:hypothetical protein
VRKRDDGSFEAVHHRLIGIASREYKARRLGSHVRAWGGLRQCLRASVAV